MGPKAKAAGARPGSSKSPAPAKKTGASTKAQDKKQSSSRASKSPGPSKDKGADKKGTSPKGKAADKNASTRGRSKSPRTPRKDQGKDKKKKVGKDAADQKDGAEEKKEVKEEKTGDVKAEEKSEEKASDAAPAGTEGGNAGGTAAEAKSSPEPAKQRRNRKKVEMPAGGLSGKIFMQAVADNDLDAVEFYLESGPLAEDVINYQNNSQMTPLMFACQHKKDLISFELLKLLLNAKGGEGGVGKVSVDTQNRDGYTALHFAARKGHAECVKILVDFDADFTIVSTGSEKKTAEQLATDNRCKQLLKNAQALKEERERMKAVAKLGLEVYTAVLKGDLRGVVRVTEKKDKGVDVPPETFSYRPNPMDHFPLRNAIDLGYFDIFKVLLDQEAEKDCPDSRGRTPLHHLISLKRAGSYPNSRFSRDKEAARMQMLTTFLETGPTTEGMLARRDNDGNTPLLIACENGYIEDILLLLERDVDVEARQISSYPYRGPPGQREKQGDTPFVLTARRRQGFNGNYMDVLDTLYYDGKANINATGTDGMTALMWAAYNEDIDLIDWLVGEGADINLQAHGFGSTALMYAAEHLRLQSMEFLLNYSMEELEKKRALEEMERRIREEEALEEAKLAARKARKTGVVGEKKGGDEDKTEEQIAKEEAEAEKKRKEEERKKNRTRSKSPQKKGKDDKKGGKGGNFKSRRSDAMMKKLGLGFMDNHSYPRHLGYYREQDPDNWAKIDIPGADPLDPPKDERECNVNVPCYNNATPLVAICRKCESLNPTHLEAMVGLMVAKGANVNQKSTDGMTPIMWAVLNNNTSLARQLLTAGAAPDTVDQLRISLLDNCKSGQMRTMIKSALDSYIKEQEQKNKEK